MIAAWLALALAFADEPPPTCEGHLTRPPEMLSVAWVSPVRQQVGRGGWIEVVPTADLRGWVASKEPTVGRMLQHLGIRKKGTEPKRRYKVTIFEVYSQALCRPLDQEDRSEPVAGVWPCEGNVGRATSRYSGCGYLTDLGDGSRSHDLYRIRWEDAAVRGFCVLPAKRFVEEAR